MPSAFILTRPSYSAMPRTGQRIHQRSMHPGPLVLRMRPLKFRTPTTDKDQTVSRRFEPSSRITLIGEQPNPWKLLHLQDILSRHRCRIFFCYQKDRTISSPLSLMKEKGVRRVSIRLRRTLRPVKVKSLQGQCFYSVERNS